jgi:hypothetical protein
MPPVLTLEFLQLSTHHKCSRAAHFFLVNTHPGPRRILHWAIGVLSGSTPFHLFILYIYWIGDVDDDLFLRLVHGVVYEGEGLRGEGRTHL